MYKQMMLYSVTKLGMSTKEFCDRIYGLVKLLSQEVENCPGSISEQARKIYRICKRVELIVSDLQPYARVSYAP